MRNQTFWVLIVAIAKDYIKVVAIILAATVVLSILGIGCPIKFATGVSCPGCGLTRAWLSFFGGDILESFRLHPLFWTVPFCILLAILEEFYKSRLLDAVLIVLIVFFVVLWIVRLVALWLSIECFLTASDVVNICKPGWLNAFMTLF
jgi:hypothetical protein